MRHMIKSIQSVKVAGRRVLLRAGFDVPLEPGPGAGRWRVADDSRIMASLPTIRLLAAGRAKIVILAHLGRPAGNWTAEKSLWPVAEKLSEALKFKLVRIKDRLPTHRAPHIYFLDEDITLNDYSELSHELPDGSILFLENLRFYAGEEAADQAFVKILSSFGELFVNDAFSVAHRNAASVVGVAKALPAYAGLSLLAEIAGLDKAVRRPQKPLVVIMGGAKISDKIDTIHFLGPLAEKVLIGGAIANSFLKAKGLEIGRSKAAEISLAKELIRHYRDKIVLPVDVVVAKTPDSPSRAVKPEKVLPHESIYDIGPETIRLFSKHIKVAKTLIWNGPMGLIENKKFAFGSTGIAHMFASRTRGQAYGVVGGGESAEVVARAKVGEFIDHVSMGGGAMLEYLSGKTLPGIKVLEK